MNLRVAFYCLAEALGGEGWQVSEMRYVENGAVATGAVPVRNKRGGLSWPRMAAWKTYVVLTKEAEDYLRQEEARRILAAQEVLATQSVLQDVHGSPDAG